MQTLTKSRPVAARLSIAAFTLTIGLGCSTSSINTPDNIQKSKPVQLQKMLQNVQQFPDNKHATGAAKPRSYISKRQQIDKLVDTANGNIATAQYFARLATIRSKEGLLYAFKEILRFGARGDQEEPRRQKPGRHSIMFYKTYELNNSDISFMQAMNTESGYDIIYSANALRDAGKNIAALESAIPDKSSHDAAAHVRNKLITVLRARENVYRALDNVKKISAATIESEQIGRMAHAEFRLVSVEMRYLRNVDSLPTIKIGKKQTLELAAAARRATQ